MQTWLLHQLEKKFAGDRQTCSQGPPKDNPDYYLQTISVAEQDFID
jgi:hypothetical protein